MTDSDSSVPQDYSESFAARAPGPAHETPVSASFDPGGAPRGVAVADSGPVQAPPAESGTHHSAWPGGPPPGRPPRPPRRSGRWPSWAVSLISVGITVIVLGVAATVLLTVVSFPYFAISPGPSKAVDELLEVENAQTYPPEGDVLLTTVSVTPVNGWVLLKSVFNSDDDLVSEESITGGRSDEEVEQVNTQLMDNSQLVATDVALRYLGYDVVLTGDGALVVEVVPEAPAASVLEAGDVIISVDGTPVKTTTELTDLLAQKKPGDGVALTVERGDEDSDAVTSLMASPDDPNKAILGVVVTTKDVRVETPGSDIEVQTDAGDIGGPSAGLSYTLAIINELTPDDVTKGKVVAATGEIDSEGNVGPVGGISQKVRSVEDAGAVVFLVPQGNYDEAITVDTDVEIIPVATLDEAMTALAGI